MGLDLSNQAIAFCSSGSSERKPMKTFIVVAESGDSLRRRPLLPRRPDQAQEALWIPVSVDQLPSQAISRRPPCRNPSSIRRHCPENTFTDSSRLYSTAIDRFSVLRTEDGVLVDVVDVFSIRIPSPLTEI